MRSMLEGQWGIRDRKVRNHMKRSIQGMKPLRMLCMEPSGQEFHDLRMVARRLLDKETFTFSRTNTSESYCNGVQGKPFRKEGTWQGRYFVTRHQIYGCCQYSIIWIRYSEALHWNYTSRDIEDPRFQPFMPDHLNKTTLSTLSLLEVRQQVSWNTCFLFCRYSSCTVASKLYSTTFLNVKRFVLWWSCWTRSHHLRQKKYTLCHINWF